MRVGALDRMCVFPLIQIGRMPDMLWRSQIKRKVLLLLRRSRVLLWRPLLLRRDIMHMEVDLVVERTRD